MSEAYFPGYEVFDEYELPEEDGVPQGIKNRIENIVEKKTGDIFQIQQKEMMTLYCKECQGSKFNVGIFMYGVYVKCMNCNWEKQVYSG